VCLCVCLSVCLSVCLCLCLSAAACLHYCTDPDVTWRSGRGCPLVVHYWADLQSGHELRCCGNITRTRNVSECMPVIALCLVANGCWQKYEQSRDDVYAAMSADATCRGLRSARDAQFLMEFSPGKSLRPHSHRSLLPVDGFRLGIHTTRVHGPSTRPWIRVSFSIPVNTAVFVTQAFCKYRIIMSSLPV